MKDRKFEKETKDLDGKYLNSGVAKLNISHWHDGIQVVTVDQDYLFGSQEPRFGTFCAVSDEDGRYVRGLSLSDWNILLLAWTSCPLLVEPNIN
jgi:hypothetical protein